MRFAPAEEDRLPTRVSGAMMLAGSALGAVSVALPPRAAGSDAIVLILVAMGVVLGAVLLRTARPLPEWLLGAAIAVGTVLVSLATHEGGSVDSGTDDNEMFYVWICLLSFNFLSLPHAFGQLALVGAVYALLLVGEPFGEAATRWLISLTTLTVAGLLVSHLRSSRERLVSNLSDRARKDGLTGILNRAALEERATLELARARRDGTPIGLVVLDVDGFKNFNDNRGHPAGDELLRAIAEGLRRETRAVDALARLGGDEFAVLLPGASVEDSELVAHRLRMIGATMAVPRATVSVGVAASGGDTGFEALWQAADVAMYEAKRAGGDAVRVAPRPAELDSAAALTA